MANILATKYLHTLNPSIILKQKNINVVLRLLINRRTINSVSRRLNCQGE